MTEVLNIENTGNAIFSVTFCTNFIKSESSAIWEKDYKKSNLNLDGYFYAF